MNSFGIFIIGSCMIGTGISFLLREPSWKIAGVIEIILGWSFMADAYFKSNQKIKSPTNAGKKRKP